MSITQLSKFMKTPQKSKTTSIIKKIFNVRKWSDFDRMRSFTEYLGTGIKKMFVPNKKAVTNTNENFLAMVASLKLSEDDLVKRQNGLYRLSVLMCVVALGIFAYTLYSLILGHWKSSIVSIVITFLALTLAFRYHYWYFQIRERKLGCTFAEWREGLFRGKNEKTDI